ncbi:MAG: glycosyltransferase [Carnobacterium sp.]|uniref:glycosyltransferase n=1 Tax=Carnobacterium sp. TaxID=48221 RepID=UPI003C7104E1
MTKRILHILSSKSFSGAENVAMTIIKNSDENYEVGYASVEGPIRTTLQKNKIEFIPMHELSVKEIRRIIKEWKPEIIHAHDFKASIKSALATLKIPIVAHIHQSPEWFKNYNIKSISVLLASTRFKKIIFVTPTLLESAKVLKRIQDKIVVISNIIDINDVYSKSKEEIISNKYDLAFIGRLEEVKNPLKFIEIVKKAKKYKNNITTVMVGGGSIRQQCEKLIREYGLEKNIEMKGFVDNPLVYLENSNICVMTSESEGLPLSVLEALSLGKPVLITELDEVIEAIGSDVLLVCKTNDDFSENIKLLNEDNNLYTKISEKSKNKALELFDMKIYMNKFNSIYQEL